MEVKHSDDLTKDSILNCKEVTMRVDSPTTIVEEWREIDIKADGTYTIKEEIIPGSRLWAFWLLSDKKDLWHKDVLPKEACLRLHNDVLTVHYKDRTYCVFEGELPLDGWELYEEPKQEPKKMTLREAIKLTNKYPVGNAKINIIYSGVNFRLDGLGMKTLCGTTTFGLDLIINNLDKEVEIIE